MKLTRETYRDVWDAAGSSRTIVDSNGARTTFTYAVPSHTAIQFPAGSRVTLAWCRSQMTAAPAMLSQFVAHVELRLQPWSASTDTRPGMFLAHPESQRQVKGATIEALHTAAKRAQWLNDVVQQANLQLLDDLQRRKAIFEGDDPERFARWFRGTSRHAVIDAIKYLLRAFAVSRLTSPDDIADSNAAEPSGVAMLSELARLTREQIERIRETKLREVMRDLRDGKSTRESANRLHISKSKVSRMQKRGCRLVAARLGR